MKEEPRGLWDDLIPALDDETASCEASGFLEKLGAIWPGQGDRLFSRFSAPLLRDPAMLGRAVAFARENARLNGRRRTDLMDIWFGLVFEERKAERG